MMHTDANAGAFMRRILANPADPLPRLVFADWLEETGASSNLAWARYLRLADELTNASAADPRRPKMSAELERIGACIRARLTYRAELLVAYPEAMLQVLPAKNMVVNLATVSVPPAIVEILPESVARERSAFPLALLGDGGIVCGSARPNDRKLVNILRFILNRPVAFVGVVEDSFDAALDRHYGHGETESVDSVPYLWLPTDGVVAPTVRPDDPIAPIVNTLILDAVVYLASALEIAPAADRLNVWHWFGGLRRRVEPPPYRYARLIADYVRSAAGVPEQGTVGELVLTYWDRARRLPVRVTETPHGPHVHITIPPETADPPAALNPAA